MALLSSPALPSSFDPAIHLHSENQEIDIPSGILQSESLSDELEAYDLVRLEKSRELTQKGVVIQHRAWQLSEVFRSDDDVQPVTPTKPTLDRKSRIICPSLSHSQLSSSPPSDGMASISSSRTMLQSPSTGNIMDHAKRKLEGDALTTPPKRPKMLGPFVMDDEDDDEDSFLNHSFNSNINSEKEPSSLSMPGLDSLPRPSGGDILSNIDCSKGPVLQTQQITRSNETANTRERFSLRSCSGKTLNVRRKITTASISYERMVAARSTTAPGRAQKSYYGVDIHKLLDDAKQSAEETAPQIPPQIQPSVEPSEIHCSSKKAGIMWTEKYRARKFKDLIGDERTHRSVLRWLKGWEPIVFPGLAKPKSKAAAGPANELEERRHRKVLLLTGPPGLGKTTLAHVCAKQAGYEVLEINASDERSRDVVKNRIRDAVGTENVKGATVDASGKARKAGKPMCVVVDEVDGVVSGSGGGGEGGFMKALIDLIHLDERNSKASATATATATTSGKKSKKKGDKFRLLRPLILVCNDVYHTSLRPLRTSSLAEIIHVRPPPLEKVVQRMRNVFENEGIPSDGDAVRRLCEASWGLTSSRDRRSNNRGVGEGDIRSVLVAGEWIAHKLRATSLVSGGRLTRKWLEQHVLKDSSGGGSSSKGLGRGGTREIVERVFVDGAAFSDGSATSESFHDPYLGGSGTAPIGVADLRKRHASNRLREMVDAAGEYDRCITDCFLTYPTKTYQDDTFLSKPNAAYDWLHFHDLMSSRVYSHQDWELNPYLSQSIIAFHNLFASSNRQQWDKNTEKQEDEEEHPFSGPWSDFAAFEAEKQHRALLTEFQSSFSPEILRGFRSTESLATELVPNLLRILVPDIKPVVVGGSEGRSAVASVRKESERALVRNAVGVMAGLNITFENAKVEADSGAYGGRIYRMEPALDNLVSFSKLKGTAMATTGSSAPVRYAIRQVLQQEYQKEQLRRRSEAQQAKLRGDSVKDASNDSSNGSAKAREPTQLSRLNGPKRDFFGRIIVNEARPKTSNGADGAKKGKGEGKKEVHAWISYHEGFSNAVRKRLSMSEFLSGL